MKQIAALEKKRAEDDWIKNMTDEELHQAIIDDLAKMGFESEEAYLDAAKKFILEKDPKANVTHDVAIYNRIFELIEDFEIFEEFMQKYSSVELTE